jgi:hypothetical protein
MQTLPAVTKPSFFQRLFRGAPKVSAPGKGITPVQAAAPDAMTIKVVASGSSGTRLFSGYFSEEYLPELTGRQAADVYDKMRRSDGDVQMVVGGIKGLLQRATCEIEPASDDPQHVRHAELIEHILFNDQENDWSETKEEAFSILEFGYFLFERTHKIVFDHPKFGAYVGIKKLGWRSPRTIERWNLDDDGRLLSVTQYAYGDLDRHVDIPAANLLHAAIGKEGDNYEGVSRLRAAYGAWWRKQLYLKLMAMGGEKYAVRPPILKVPANATQADRDEAEESLEKFSSSESNYLMIPAGWDFTSVESDFDPDKMKICLDYEGIQIGRALCMQFLFLGTGTASGSWALSTDLSDFSLSALEYVADRVAAPFNTKLIPELVRLNFGPQDAYPKMKFSGISDRAGKELAEMMKAYLDSGAIEADDDLEANLRKRNGLPKKGKPRPKPVPPVAAGAPGAPGQDPKPAEPGADPAKEGDPAADPAAVKKKP